MFNTSLAQAVECFAQVTHDAPDVELDREWAWGAYDSEGVRLAFFRTYEELRELAARLATERAAHGPVTSTVQRILAQRHAAYRDLQAILLGIGTDEAEQVPAEGEWPLRQVMAHIVAAELGFFAVIKYALERHRSGDARPAKIPDEAWDALIGEDGATIEATLDGPLAGIQSYGQALHERVVQEFADVSEEELAAPSMYWEGYELSLRFRLHRFDSHLRQHIVQIEKTLAGIGRSPNEARRLLRLIYAALAEVEGVTIGAGQVGVGLRREAAEAIAARASEVASILA
ncbi:MAG: DinB family protein [Anaerolineae bacterium]|nr:MAG: DinB family protein [Anaerolineae bacterium]